MNAPASLRCILPHGPILQGQRLHPNRTSGSPAIEFVFAKFRLEVDVGIADKPLTGHCARRCFKPGWLGYLPLESKGYEHEVTFLTEKKRLLRS